ELAPGVTEEDLHPSIMTFAPQAGEEGAPTTSTLPLPDSRSRWITRVCPGSSSSRYAISGSVPRNRLNRRIDPARTATIVQGRLPPISPRRTPLRNSHLVTSDPPDLHHRGPLAA